MPLRLTLMTLRKLRAKGRGITRLTIKAAIRHGNSPGDVLVVDLSLGKQGQRKQLVGDNLFYYLARLHTSADWLLDGSSPRSGRNFGNPRMPALSTVTPIRHAHWQRDADGNKYPNTDWQHPLA